ncbi:MAG: hypothetical protein ACP5H2_06210 [Solirubrobacteraceae bacterium]
MSSTSKMSGQFARELQPHLDDEARTSDVELVLALDGGHTYSPTDLPAAAFAIEDGREVALAWNIPRALFAVLVDRDGVVRTGTFVQHATDLLKLTRLLPGAVQVAHTPDG